jgi:hypothetical protein
LIPIARTKKKGKQLAFDTESAQGHMSAELEGAIQVLHGN